MAVWLALAATGIFIVLTFLHVGFINGPWWWKWGWHDPGLVESLQILAMLLLPLALVLYATRDDDRPRRYGRRLAVLTVASLIVHAYALPLQRDLPLPSTVAGRIKSVWHGHFVAAERLMATGDDWLARFHELSPGLTVHPRVQPPGPALTHAAVLSVVGDSNRAAMASGVLLLLGGAMTPAGTYLLARGLRFRRWASLHGAGVATLLPAFAVFFPWFDQTYAAWVAAMLAAWVWGLRTDRIGFSAVFGVMLAVAGFHQYRLLTVGVLVAGLAVLRLAFAPRMRLPQLVKHAAVGLAAVAASYAVFWLLTGFRPDLAFLQAIHNQEENLVPLNRHLPFTIPWDLWDFAFGLGCLPLLLAAAEAVRRLATQPHREHAWLLLLFLAQPVIIAGTGLIPSETARCLMFLMPTIAIAAGLLVARQPTPVRVAIYAMQALTIATLGLNMWFQ